MSPKHSPLLLLALSLGLSTIASTARAEVDPIERLAEGWNSHYYLPFVQRLSQVSTVAPVTEAERTGCDNFYSRVKSTGRMKIVLGIGYYDFSEGEPFVLNYNEGFTQRQFDFGANATVDRAFYLSYRDILLRSCSGQLRICGFSETSPGTFTKTVRTQEGQSVQAVVEMKYSSASYNHAQNVGPYRDQQTSRSEANTRWFFGSIDSADLVIYNGHSRRGGGPDFSPPRLRTTGTLAGHVNYDWYERNTPGLSRLLSALRAAPRKPSALMLMSCNSNALFGRRISAAAPGMAYVGTQAVLPGVIPAKTAIAGIDSFLRFQCQTGFNRALHVDRDMAEQIRTIDIR